jgi:hypothetical protein
MRDPRIDEKVGTHGTPRGLPNQREELAGTAMADKDDGAIGWHFTQFVADGVRMLL